MQPLALVAIKVSLIKIALVIAEGSGNPEAIANRGQAHKIETTTFWIWPWKLQERYNCLAVAVIKVGAATETELKEMKLRIEDALNATSCSRWRRDRFRRRLLSSSLVAGPWIGRGWSRSTQYRSSCFWSQFAKLLTMLATKDPQIDRLKNAEAGTGFNKANR